MTAAAWFGGTAGLDGGAATRQRLHSQLRAVFVVMRDGRWRSLADIAAAVNAPTASVSARIRDLRKPMFGEHVVQRRYRGGGVYEYRLGQHHEPNIDADGGARR